MKNTYYYEYSINPFIEDKLILDAAIRKLENYNQQIISVEDRHIINCEKFSIYVGAKHQIVTMHLFKLDYSKADEIYKEMFQLAFEVNKSSVYSELMQSTGLIIISLFDMHEMQEAYKYKRILYGLSGRFSNLFVGKVAAIAQASIAHEMRANGEIPPNINISIDLK